jgi:hypothetical protein
MTDKYHKIRIIITFTTQKVMITVANQKSVWWTGHVELMAEMRDAY